MSKYNFDNKIVSFNKTITSSKAKSLEPQKKLNNLTTNGYNFFLGRMYFKIDLKMCLFINQHLIS